MKTCDLNDLTLGTAVIKAYRLWIWPWCVIGCAFLLAGKCNWLSSTSHLLYMTAFSYDMHRLKISIMMMN